MRQSHPTSLSHYVAASRDEDHERGLDRRHAQQRALRESPGAGSASPGPVRAAVHLLATAIRGGAQRARTLTDQPCRLPDGRIGRVEVVEQSGDWVLVCRVA